MSEYNNSLKLLLTNNAHDDKYWNLKCSEAGILYRQTHSVFKIFELVSDGNTKNIMLWVVNDEITKLIVAYFDVITLH